MEQWFCNNCLVKLRYQTTVFAWRVTKLYRSRKNIYQAYISLYIPLPAHLLMIYTFSLSIGLHSE